MKNQLFVGVCLTLATRNVKSGDIKKCAQSVNAFFTCLLIPEILIAKSFFLQRDNDLESIYIFGRGKSVIKI